MRVLVLGAGFGGLELTTRLSYELGGDADIVLINKADGFVFGFSKLDVMFGRTTPQAVRHPHPRPGEAGRPVRPDRDPVHRPGAAPGRDGRRRVRRRRDGGGPGSRPRSIGDAWAGRSRPRVLTVDGAFAARDVLDSFGGGRVVVGVTSTPFTCPPAPSETALMLHDYLVARGMRAASEISLVMPLGAPIPPSPAASQALLAEFAERGSAGTRTGWCEAWTRSDG